VRENTAGHPPFLPVVSTLNSIGYRRMGPTPGDLYTVYFDLTAKKTSWSDAFYFDGACPPELCRWWFWFARGRFQWVDLARVCVFDLHVVQNPCRFWFSYWWCLSAGLKLRVCSLQHRLKFACGFALSPQRKQRFWSSGVYFDLLEYLRCTTHLQYNAPAVLQSLWWLETKPSADANLGTHPNTGKAMSSQHHL